MGQVDTSQMDPKQRLLAALAGRISGDYGLLRLEQEFCDMREERRRYRDERRRDRRTREMHDAARNAYQSLAAESWQVQEMRRSNRAHPSGVKEAMGRGVPTESTEPPPAAAPPPKAKSRPSILDEPVEPLDPATVASSAIIPVYPNTRPLPSSYPPPGMRHCYGLRVRTEYSDQARQGRRLQQPFADVRGADNRAPSTNVTVIQREPVFSGGQAWQPTKRLPQRNLLPPLRLPDGAYEPCQRFDGARRNDTLSTKPPYL
eukprot:Hpha_TRINITY_DN8457_c0_g1::TRINITY_DN8457_c0_g1_i1::g.34847::m.34847